MLNKPNDAGVQRLIDYIGSRNLEAGQRLPAIKNLATELQLPPHAVRDALLQAQTMGLIRVQPRSGSYVQVQNFAPLVDVFSRSLPQILSRCDPSLFDLLEARRLIELEVATMAGRRRRLADLVPLREALQGMYACPDDYNAYMAHNEAFHLGIAKIAGNEVLRAMLQCLLVLLRPVVNECQPHNWKENGCQKRDRDAREHEEIFQALLADDAAAVRRAMATHLQDTEVSLKLALGQGNNEVVSTASPAPL